MCGSDGLRLVAFAGQLYGIEKYWAFLKYYKSAKQLPVDARLKELLASFKTVEDFRVLEPEINEMLQGVGTMRSSPDKRRIRSISESEGVAKAVHQQPGGGRLGGGGAAAGTGGYNAGAYGRSNGDGSYGGYNNNGGSKYRKR